MSNHQDLIICVILTLTRISCQVYRRYSNDIYHKDYAVSVRPMSINWPFLSNGRDYFEPRIANIIRRKQLLSVSPVRKIWGPDTGYGFCNCEYHSDPGGCRIYQGAPQEGLKCQCRYIGFWTCDGVVSPCSYEESCPAGCTSFTCCRQGKGDCNGYDPQPSAAP